MVDTYVQLKRLTMSTRAMACPRERWRQEINGISPINSAPFSLALSVSLSSRASSAKRTFLTSCLNAMGPQERGQRKRFEASGCYSLVVVTSREIPEINSYLKSNFSLITTSPKAQRNQNVNQLAARAANFSTLEMHRTRSKTLGSCNNDGPTCSNLALQEPAAGKRHLFFPHFHATKSVITNYADASPGHVWSP